VGGGGGAPRAAGRRARGGGGGGGGGDISLSQRASPAKEKRVVTCAHYQLNC
jgi:hypothetical protein